MKSLRRLACYALFFYNICMRSFLQVTEPSSAKALLNLLKCNVCFPDDFHACMCAPGLPKPMEGNSTFLSGS